MPSLEIKVYQVNPERSWEEDRILWNDRQLGPEVVQADLADVDAVDRDRTLSSLD